jgi:hypothetical protein
MGKAQFSREFTAINPNNKTPAAFLDFTDEVPAMGLENCYH